MQVAITCAERVTLALVIVVVRSLRVPLPNDLRQVVITVLDNANDLANIGKTGKPSETNMAVFIMANCALLCIPLCDFSKFGTPVL